MDGENNGKPYVQMDDLEGKPTIFGNTHGFLLSPKPPLSTLEAYDDKYKTASQSLGNLGEATWGPRLGRWLVDVGGWGLEPWAMGSRRRKRRGVVGWVWKKCWELLGFCYILLFFKENKNGVTKNIYV